MHQYIYIYIYTQSSGVSSKNIIILCDKTSQRYYQQITNICKTTPRGRCKCRGCNMDVKKELYDQKIRDVYRNVWFPERHVKNINLYIIT